MTGERYPYDMWPRLTREEVRRRNEGLLGCRFDELFAVDDGEAWLGVPCSFSVRETIDTRIPLELDPCVHVLLVDDRGQRLGLSVDPPLAVALIQRTLGLEAPMASSGPLTDMERGILAYAFARLLLGSRFLVGAIYTRPGALALALRDPVQAAFRGRLRLGTSSGAVAIYTAVDLRNDAGAPLRGRGALPDIPLVAWVDGGSAQLGRAIVESLTPGDVLLPDVVSLRHDHDGAAQHGRLVGRGWLRVSGVPGFRCALGAVDGMLAVLHPPEVEGNARARRGKIQMQDEVQSVLEEAPVELSVEVARVELTVGELGRLTPGQVVLTAAEVGSNVALRVGSKVLFFGELVQVDGELGVRILQAADTRDARAPAKQE